MRFQVIGMRGDAGFEALVEHFRSLGGDAVLLEPEMVAGRDHLMAAALHAERAFAEGTNRSNSLPTEIILYAAWDRQIGRAMERMRPKGDGYAAVLIDVGDPMLDAVGMVRDDSLLDPTPERVEALGLGDPFLSPCDQAVERVALLELQKMRGDMMRSVWSDANHLAYTNLECKQHCGLYTERVVQDRHRDGCAL